MGSMSGKLRALYYAILIGASGTDRDIRRLVDLVFDGYGGLLKPKQDRAEITEFMRLVDEMRPGAMLEIGTASGGTLFLLARLASEDAVIISVDLPGGRFGGGYSSGRAHIYRLFGRWRQKMHLVRADSHDPSTLEKVEGILKGRPLDLLFIDGDHTYEGVKKDFELYSRLVRKGGVIAFHDIVVHPPETGCDVHSFWEEVKKGYRHREFITDSNQKAFGIGVLYVD